MNPSEPPPAGDRVVGDQAEGRSGGLAGWQKVIGIVGLALVVLLAILLATGDHGPGRHVPGGGREQPAEAEDIPGHDPSRWNH